MERRTSQKDAEKLKKKGREGVRKDGMDGRREGRLRKDKDEWHGRMKKEEKEKEG